MMAAMTMVKTIFSSRVLGINSELLLSVVLKMFAAFKQKKEARRGNLRQTSLRDYHSLPRMIAQKFLLHKSFFPVSPILRNFIHKRPESFGGLLYRSDAAKRRPEPGTGKWNGATSCSGPPEVVSGQACRQFTKRVVQLKQFYCHFGKTFS